MAFYITEACGEDERVIYRRLTGRGTYVVKDSTMGGERVRLLLVDGIQESAVNLSPERRNVPLFRYLVDLHRVVEEHPTPARVLLIGGAGFAYPKLFFSSGQKGSLTVVELDPRMVRLARRYFFLDEMEQDFDLKRNGRFRIVLDEGLRFLENTDERFDVILNDAYLGNVPDAELLFDTGLAACRAHLSPGGVLAVNLITPLAAEGAMTGIMAKKRMETYFDGVSLTPCDDTYPVSVRQNCILRGSVPGGGTRRGVYRDLSSVGRMTES